MDLKTPTRADTLALIARHLREHFGDELRRLFVLPVDPYEPETMGFDYTLVAVTARDVREKVHEVVTEMTPNLLPEVAFVYPMTVHEFKDATTDVARAAREAGVEL